MTRAGIGLSLPPAEGAINESGWAPDEIEAYCPRCGSGVGPGEQDAKGCASCRSHRLAYDRVTRLGSYDGALRHWVTSMKYRRWVEMTAALGRRLGEAVAHVGAVDLDRTLVVPMPMPWQRRLYRGVDHALLLADAVAAALTGARTSALTAGLTSAGGATGNSSWFSWWWRRCRCDDGVPVVRLLSKRNGRPQVALSATERRTNLRDRVKVRRGLRAVDLSGWDVVLVDDVRTTGASLQAASRVIRRLNPRRIAAAVVAVADGAQRRGATAKRVVTGISMP